MNSYSIDPVLWTYFDKDDSILIAASIPMKRAISLAEAINRVNQLEEFK